MSQDTEPDLKSIPTAGRVLEVAHVLFMDIVSYSLLPMDDQSEAVLELQKIVRETSEFARSLSTGELVCLPTGDGMALAFFGDPSSPVRCALEIAGTLKKTPRFGLRMGIHTGPVYRIADINRNLNLSGGGINVAQRVMDAGDAGHILISRASADMLLQLSATWKSALHDLGDLTVKHGAVIQAFNFYTPEFGNAEVPKRLIQQTQAASAGLREPARPAPRGPLADPPAPHAIGRHAELAILEAAANSGRGSVLLISGEPGIGKTTLLETFLASRTAGFTATGHCTGHMGGLEAFLPVLEILETLARDQRARDALMDAAPAWYVQLVPHSISTPGIGAVMDAARASTLQRLKREMLEFLRRLCGIGPVTLLIEDLHWSDPSTLDMFAFLAARCPELPLLIVASFRPTGFSPDQSHFLEIKLDLQSRGIAREVQVSLLSEQDVREYLTREFNQAPVSPQAVRYIHGQTEGNPLFIVNLVRDLRNTGALRLEGATLKLDRNALSGGCGVPESIEAIIDRNMARLPASDRELLETAAVFGTDFDSALLAALMAYSPEAVEESLAAIESLHGLIRWKRDELLPSGEATRRYEFSHALYQRALMNSLTPSKRRRLSRAAAEKLLAAYNGNISAFAAQTASLFDFAGDYLHAAALYLEAGRQAGRLSGHEEAIALAQLSLSAAAKLSPGPERANLEMNAQMLLGKERQTERGMGSEEAQSCYQKALSLAEEFSLLEGQVLARTGLMACSILQNKLEQASNEAEALMSLARQSGNSALIAVAYFALSTIKGERADFAAAIAMQQAAIRPEKDPAPASSTTVIPLNPSVGCRGQQAVLQWLTGHPDTALRLAEEGLQVARDLRDPYSVAFSLNQLALVHLYRREPPDTLERAREAAQLAEEYGFKDVAGWAQLGRGWALAALGEREEGISQMRDALQELRNCRFEFARPFFLNALTETLLEEARYVEAKNLADEAIATMQATGGVCYMAESRRLRALALAALGDAENARLELNAAIAIAAEQGAAGWELRCAISAQTICPQRTPALLRSALAKFSEGFGTADVLRAKAMTGH